MAWFCATILRDSVSLLRYHFFLAISSFSCKQFRQFVFWNIHTFFFVQFLFPSVLMFFCLYFYSVICRDDKILWFIIILLFWEFFTPALADGFSLEFEWQQVSSSINNSTQYSGRS